MDALKTKMAEAAKSAELAVYLQHFRREREYALANPETPREEEMPGLLGAILLAGADGLAVLSESRRRLLARLALAAAERVRDAAAGVGAGGEV